MKVYLLLLFLFVIPNAQAELVPCQPSEYLKDISDFISKKSYADLEVLLKKEKKKLANFKNKSCETLYHIAIRIRDEKFRKLLDSTGYGPRNSKAINETSRDMFKAGLLSSSYFEWSLQFGVPSSYEDLLKRGGKILGNYSHNQNHLHVAVDACNNSGMITHLAKKGWEIHKTNDFRIRPPIQYASEKCNKKVIEEIIKNGGDVNYIYVNNYSEDEAPFLSLIKRFKEGKVGLDTIEVLLKAGLDLSTIYDLDTVLIKAIGTFDLSLVELILDYGADINQATEHHTALSEAISMHRIPYYKEDFTDPKFAENSKNVISMIKLLLERGANPNLAAKNARSPIFLQSVALPAEGVLLLLKYGVNTRVRDDRGYNFLHSGALWQTPEVLLQVAEAIGKGFDLRNNNGLYPSQNYVLVSKNPSSSVHNTLLQIEKRLK